MENKEYARAMAMVEKNEALYERQFRYIARTFLMEEFDLELRVPITLNGRISRALGRFKWKRTEYGNISIGIEISKKMIADALMNDRFHQVIDTLKHECVHYALFEKGIPHSDNDWQFTEACVSRGVGLTRTKRIAQMVNVYECSEGHEITRARKFNVDHYRCHCGCKLHYKGRELK